MREALWYVFGLFVPLGIVLVGICIFNNPQAAMLFSGLTLLIAALVLRPEEL